MSRIKSKDTAPELRVRKYLFKNGLRYRLHSKNLPGKPDIVFPRFKTALFVHGCFWHSHSGCKFAVTPKSNINYWSQKINRNIERDKENLIKLNECGWQIILIWECELKKANFEETMANILKRIIGQK